MAKRLLEIISSSRLALVLVLALMFLSLGGAMLPQEGRMEPAEIISWQARHPAVTSLLEPVGLFHVFNSWPFLATILLLSINTLTCTLLRFVRAGGIAALSGPRAVGLIGFLVLHLSLLVLFAGGFISAATRMDGYVMLTEGQSFQEGHDNYAMLAEGPLRPQRHQEFQVRLLKVGITYAREHYPVMIASRLEIRDRDQAPEEGIVKVNQPFSYKSLDFTQDRTGFSPRLVVRDRRSLRVLLNSFIALQTFDTSEGKQYRDFLALPIFKQRIILTVYPSHAVKDGRVVKTGDEPVNPIVVIALEDATGQSVAQAAVALGQEVGLGDYGFTFAELRRWSGFKVVEDPGYLTVCVGLWLGLGALIFRYVPDLKRWFQE